MLRKLAAFSLIAAMFALTGCSHDADPHAKIDDPGYFNGSKGPTPETSQGMRRARSGISADE